MCLRHSKACDLPALPVQCEITAGGDPDVMFSQQATCTPACGICSNGSVLSLADDMTRHCLVGWVRDDNRIQQLKGTMTEFSS